jgi:FkbM family methyltransferase
LAQRVFDSLVAPATGRRHQRLVRRAHTFARRRLIAAGDPCVAWSFEGGRLLLPLSHSLPIYRRDFPGYSANLLRIARHVQRKYPASPVIDVGANVGDSVLLLRQAAHMPILCIEGDAKYLDYLRRNTNNLEGVEVEPSFLGRSTTTVPGTVMVSNGTARIDVAPSGTGSGAVGIPVVSLDDVLLRHPRFRASRLFKVDTDGFDAEILVSSKPFLAVARPVLFFEYDPAFLETGPLTGVELLREIREFGYVAIAAYDNLGDYLLSASLDDERLLTDVDAHFRGRGSARYLDIAAFHEDDLDILEAVRSHELALAGSRRP